MQILECHVDMNWKSKKPSQLVFFDVATANDSVPCSHHQKCLNHKYILLTEKNCDHHSPFSWLVPAISDKYKDSKCKSNDTVSMKLYLLSLVWLGIFHRRWWKNGVVILKFLEKLRIRLLLRNLLLCTRDTVIRARDIKKYQLRCFFWFPIHIHLYFTIFFSFWLSSGLDFPNSTGPQHLTRDGLTSEVYGHITFFAVG